MNLYEFYVLEIFVGFLDYKLILERGWICKRHIPENKLWAEIMFFDIIIILVFERNSHAAEPQ